MFPGHRSAMRRGAQAPVTGYFDRLSGLAGETLSLKVSTRDGGPVHARMLRVRLGDANPTANGPLYDDVADLGQFEGQHQDIDLGSYAKLPDVEVPGSATFVVNVQPWLLRDQASTIAAGADWTLDCDTTGLTLRAGRKTLHLGADLVRKHWYRIWLWQCSETGESGLGCNALPSPERPMTVLNKTIVGQMPPFVPSPVTLAARMSAGLSTDHFNGRLEDPAVLSGIFRDLPPAADENALAFWDFSQGIETQTALDRGASAAHGKLVNVPTRAVRGSHWNGDVMKWTESPRHYAAIHFHEDDLYDCYWQTSLKVTIPAGTPSGIYAVALRAGADQDMIPFYVLPGADKKRICFLASTYTYQCYANFARGNLDADLRERMAKWDVPQQNPDDYDLYGFSVYNFHPDGSGHHFSSRLRPILTMRPGFLTFCDPKGSGIRHFPADTHLTHWLEQMNYEFDIVTDEDLDQQGIDLISGYDIVLTGSHPEYHTTGTLDALADYQSRGGHFCYLGGNGFYWRIETTPALPGMLELRRAELGMRAWGTDVAENYHQINPTYGGLWRRAGRAPQMICGVGFSAQGGFSGSYYRLKPDAHDTAPWLLEGISGPIIGDYGLNGGASAGFELDRADVELGTPPDAVILASSENHDDSFTPPPEEILSPGKTMTGEPEDQLIRSDIIWYRAPGGGQVFSVGSIFFCGGLLVNDSDNDISRLLRNVLNGMLNDHQPPEKEML